MDDRQHFDAIYRVVRNIPAGYVMSYGQVGQEAGGVSARTVGWAMANALDGDVPWQRVVGADGYLRIGRRSVQLQDLQRLMLEREGVAFLESGCVDLGHHQVGVDEGRGDEGTEEARPDDSLGGEALDEVIERTDRLKRHPGGGYFHFG